jgi:hypothetical protein
MRIIAGLTLALALSATTVSGQQETPKPPPPVPGDTLVTQPGYVGCLERVRFHEIMEKASNGDQAGVRAMLEDRNSGCFRLKAGLRVTMLSNVILFAQVRPELAPDRPFWTVVEALTWPDPPARGAGQGGRS